MTGDCRETSQVGEGLARGGGKNSSVGRGLGGGGGEEEKKEEEVMERPYHSLSTPPPKTNCATCYSTYDVEGEGDRKLRGYRNYLVMARCCGKAYCKFHLNEHLGFVDEEDETPLLPANKNVYLKEK